MTPSPPTLEKGRCLIVDDELDIRDLVSSLLEHDGFMALTADDGQSALQQLRTAAPDVLIIDMHLPDFDGMEILRQARLLDADLPVVVLTAHAEVRGAVQAMRANAYEYLAKPYDNLELLRVVRQALAERRYKLRLRQAGGQINVHHELSLSMGPSAAIQRLIADVNRVAGSDFSVLIIGETGSGKELVAQAIHRSSKRANRPFVPMDCGAIPETLLESELFGYEKGSFTGAIGGKRGKFELANGGTFMLDEISNLSLNAQAKLLRVLQEKTIYRVGGTQAIATDTRVLAAGNQDLDAAVSAGCFRQDLYYRLNEFTLRIPPLRQRKEDIIFLAKRFLDLTNLELHKMVRGFSESAIHLLLNHPWPGNVRQLRSTIRRSVLLATSEVTEDHLDIVLEAGVVPPHATGSHDVLGSAPPLSLKDIVAQSTTALEREVLVQTLRRTGGNKAKAARLLHIDYKTAQSKIRKYGISQGDQETT
jgi:DNA-binding NtrC family response regulator